MSCMVRWRDPETRRQHGVTFRAQDEASELMRALNASGQSLAGALRSIRRQKPVAPTVGEVVQEHIDLLVRPSPGSIRTYQRMLELHIQGTIGAIAVDAFGYRDIMRWVQSLLRQGVAPKTIHNVHGLLSAAMTTAEVLGYISRNPCRGVRLPTIEHVEDSTVLPRSDQDRGRQAHHRAEPRPGRTPHPDSGRPERHRPPVHHTRRQPHRRKAILGTLLATRRPRRPIARTNQVPTHPRPAAHTRLLAYPGR